MIISQIIDQSEHGIYITELEQKQKPPETQLIACHFQKP